MEVDKFGRFRKNETGGRSIPSYQLLQLQRFLKSDISSFLSEKNLDKLILSRASDTDDSIRIKNVFADENSFPTDAVNISYMRREITSLHSKKNFDKLILVGSESDNLIRLRNIKVDENSLPNDAVNMEALTLLREKIELLEKEVESMKILLVGAKSITYSRDAATTSFST